MSLQAKAREQEVLYDHWPAEVDECQSHVVTKLHHQKKKKKTQQLLKSFALCVIPAFFLLCWFLSSYILFSNCHTALPPLNPPPRCLLPSLFFFSSQTSRTSCSETVFFNCLSVEYVDGQVAHSDRPRETDHTGNHRGSSARRCSWTVLRLKFKCLTFCCLDVRFGASGVRGSHDGEAHEYIFFLHFFFIFCSVCDTNHVDRDKQEWLLVKFHCRCTIGRGHCTVNTAGISASYLSYLHCSRVTVVSLPPKQEQRTINQPSHNPGHSLFF